MIQPAKKGFRTPADFINAANDQPEQVKIDPAAGTVSVTPAVSEPPTPIANAVAQPETPVASDSSEKDDQPRVGVKKTAQKPAKSVPWANAIDQIKVGYNYRMTQTLHQKMVWITENVPKHSSMQIIIQKAVEDLVEKLLKENYKP